eukprot:c52891_g1_i1.p1 GENE.c52891_g1_i1~~c52891_g1_i1.p1  ORF type:complete len:619 (-),score=160.90 c52891_g1_i1:107-1909(-)
MGNEAEMSIAERKKAEKAAKKAAANAKREAKKEKPAAGETPEVEEEEVPQEAKVVISDRTTTGLLVSEKNSRDIKIIQFSLSMFGRVFVNDTTIELNWGNRYGLIGRNGSGKSTFLRCLAERDVPIPEHFDTYLLSEEAPPCEMTGLQYVIASAAEEVIRLDKQIEKILSEEGADCPLLLDLYDRLEELDESTFESRASSILVGLGFNTNSMHKRTCDMSGGWRMRVALARALFVSPALLLMDEPTNHLDLAACVWLEEYLSTYSKILVIVSHSQDFLNGVCTHTMQLSEQQLRYWGGNYDTYCATKAEQEKNTWTLYKKQQDFIKDTKQFIASCGTYSNLVKQGKSRQKMLDKMESELVKAPYSEPLFRFRFPSTGALTPPLISFTDVSFSYSGKKEDYLFHNLSFGIDADSRISLVGPNGAGKSTLLKLIVGQVQPTIGNISLRSGMVIGRYHQHSAEVLDLEKCPVDYIRDRFQDRYPEKKFEDWRAIVGQWGIPSEYHLRPISHLSEGLKTRLVFCEIATTRPHLLLLDEPTNAADMEMIDSMAEAINNFEGGVVIVSHDFRLLSQTAKEIWVVDQGLKVFDGDIRAYKKTLQKKK